MVDSKGLGGAFVGFRQDGKPLTLPSNTCMQLPLVEQLLWPGSQGTLSFPFLSFLLVVEGEGAYVISN